MTTSTNDHAPTCAVDCGCRGSTDETDAPSGTSRMRGAVRRRRRPLQVLGLGAAACAACCAGPIIAFVAATGVLTVGGFAAFGVAGLLIAVPGVLLIARRRRRAGSCAVPSEPVAVGSPARPPDSDRLSDE